MSEALIEEGDYSAASTALAHLHQELELWSYRRRFVAQLLADLATQQGDHLEALRWEERADHDAPAGVTPSLRVQRGPRGLVTLVFVALLVAVGSILVILR